MFFPLVVTLKEENCFCWESLLSTDMRRVSGWRFEKARAFQIDDSSTQAQIHWTDSDDDVNSVNSLFRILLN